MVIIRVSVVLSHIYAIVKWNDCVDEKKTPIVANSVYSLKRIKTFLVLDRFSRLNTVVTTLFFFIPVGYLCWLVIKRFLYFVVVIFCEPRSLIRRVLMSTVSLYLPFFRLGALA